MQVPSAVKLQPEPVPGPESPTEPEPQTDPEPQLPPDPAPHQGALDMGPQVEEKQGSKLPIVLAVLVLLLAAAAALWFFVLRDTGPAPAEQPAASEQAPAEPASELAAEPAPVRQPQTAMPFLGTARQHLQGSADPAKSLELAKPMRTMEADSETSDGAFLLIEDAAQKGNAEAMFLLAQFYDPANTLPRGSIQPDLAQAAEWYARAARNGIAAAQEGLAAVKTQLEQKAAAGDAEAARILQGL